MESNVRNITEKYLKLEMNTEEEILIDTEERNAIRLEDVIPSIENDIWSGNIYEDSIKEIEYIMECIEKNQKLFQKLIPSYKCILGEPLTKITYLKNYCSFLISVMRERILWKYIEIGDLDPTLEEIVSIWNTICFALFDNPTLCSNYLLREHSRYHPNIYMSDYRLAFSVSTITMKTAIIILDDSDLDAAVNFFISLKNEPSVWEIIKVYIQESILKKFMQRFNDKKFKISWILKLNSEIFRSLAELSLKINENQIDAISIWTENITAAKYFVMNLMIRLVWINCFGELGPGIILGIKSKLPKLEPYTPNRLKTDFYEGSGKRIDLFYNGLWNEPKNKKYWFDNNGTSWASAEQEDMNNCVQSARSGFNKWRSLSQNQRKEALLKFANRINADGDKSLANVIKSQIENPTLYGSSSTIIRDGTVEILTIRDPKGIIVIVGNDHNDFFCQLTNACIAGNSIIVIYFGDLFSIDKYFDIMITSGILPGVINLLSFSNPSDIDTLRQNFSVFVSAENLVFQHRKENRNEFLYMKYTQPKSIWLPLK